MNSFLPIAADSLKQIPNLIVSEPMIARPADKSENASRTSIWQQYASRINPSPNAKPTGWLCLQNRAVPITEIDLFEIMPGRGLLVHTRVESGLISLPEELLSDELLTPCRAPANPTNCHPSTRNRTAATTAAFWNSNEDVSGVEIA
jgi:hypothetical protein